MVWVFPYQNQKMGAQIVSKRVQGLHVRNILVISFVNQ